MIIHYKDRKLEKILTSENEIKRTYGKLSGPLMLRLNELQNVFENLAEIPNTPPQRFHDLRNYRSPKAKAGIQYFSIDLSKNYRLVIHPVPLEIPKNEHGKWMLEEVKELLIVGIEDTHE